MSTRSVKILLVGFGPFPKVPYNASVALVREVAAAARQRFSDCSVETLELPTDWQAAPLQLHQTLNNQRADLVLMFGVSAKATGFEIETNASNITCQTSDAADQLPTLDCLQVCGPNDLPVTLDTAAIARMLEERHIPAKLSHDAGAYLCNAMLYHALLYGQDHAPHLQAGFIHLPDRLSPPDEDNTRRTDDHDDRRNAEQPALSWPEAVRGSLEIIGVGISSIQSARNSG